MYAPPGAIDAPRPAAAEAALTKAQRQKSAERRKHWLAKNAAPLPHRVIKGGLSKKQISDVLLFPRHRHTTLNKSLVNAQRAHERDRERTRLANLQAVLDAEQKKRDAEDLQAAKDAEKKFIKSDTEKKSSLLNSWRRYQGTHPMLDPDRMTLRNAARAAFTAADTSAASLAAGTARRVLDEAEAKRIADELEAKRFKFLVDHSPLRLRLKGAADNDDVPSLPSLAKDAEGSLEERQELLEERLEYFDGTRGRMRFFKAYQEALTIGSSKADEYLEEESDHPQQIARDFNKVLVDLGVAPKPALLKQTRDGVLALRALCPNDAVARAIAKVLPRLPHLYKVDIADNRLGDVALKEIVDAVNTTSTITSLDLSRNKIDDEASEAIMALIGNHEHGLKELVMSDADVDDGECATLISTLEHNKVLQTLDLSHNMLGAWETKNVVEPDTITGPEQIASCLSTGTLSLTSLDLSWNFIRGDSAEQLGASLATCASLQKLVLAYNTFGDRPSQVLALALQSDKCMLRVLDLSYNNVKPRAALCLAAALKRNEHLRFVNLDGNPVGRVGARSLMSSLQGCGHDLELTLKECDRELEDGTLFNSEEPGGKYRLDMSVPYDKVVCMELIQVATLRDFSQFTELRHYPPGVKPPPINSEEKAGKEIVLSRTDAKGKPLPGRMLTPPKAPGQQPMWPLLFARCAKSLDRKELSSIFLWMGFEPDTKPILDQFNKRLPKDITDKKSLLRELWLAVFAVADADESGAVDPDELQKLIQDVLQVECTPEKAQDIFKEYDLDGSNLLEALEFADLCAKVFEPSTDTFKGPLVAEKEKSPWVPPDSGILDIVFECPPSAASVDEVGSDDGVELILKLLAKAETPSERQIIFDVSCSQTDIFLTGEQARKVFHAAVCDYTPVDKVAKLLPQVAQVQDACTFAELCLDTAQLRQLREKLSYAWGPLTGNPTGHYCLDFRLEMHRLAGKKIAGLATAQRSLDERLNRSDRAQHGNGYGFRNERFNGDPLVLTPQWFTGLEEKDGILRFDFVSSERCIQSTPTLSERRFDALLTGAGFTTTTYQRPKTPAPPKVRFEEQEDKEESPTESRGILSPSTKSRMGERRREAEAEAAAHRAEEELEREAKQIREGEDPIEYAARIQQEKKAREEARKEAAREAKRKFLEEVAAREAEESDYEARLGPTRWGAARTTMDSPQVLRKGTTLTTEDLEGVRTPRRVLVTGANRGLGLEIVKALLERDDVDKVYLGCRDFEAGTALCCGELWDLGGDRSEAVELDVSDGESIKRAVDYVSKTLAARDDGHVQKSREYLDAIVNNAGIFLDAEADIYRKSAAARASLAVNFEGAMNVTTAFLPLLADDATVVNVSSRQAARTLGFLEPRHRDAFEANDIEAVRRAAYEVADLLDDDYGPYTTLATPAHGLSKCALNAWTRIMAQQRPEMRFLAVAPGQLRTRHNPVVWEGGLRPRPPRLGARVVVDALYGAHASGSFLAQTCASDGTRFLRGEYETHDDSWESSATQVVDWVVEPPAAIGPGTSAPVDSHGRTGSLRRSQELLPREY